MNYLSATYYYDYEHPNIQEIIQPFLTDVLTPKEKAVQLYLKIRDGWRYNAGYISFKKENYKASHIVQKKDGHCIDKSIMLVTCLRGVGIPARIHLAKVKNHIAVERLIEKFGTNELTPHGMVNMLLDGEWLKASPAFNAELCAKCNVAPLDFDGTQDSIFQEYNNEGKEFMEYLEDYGHFEDFPFDFVTQNLLEHYPKLKDYLHQNEIKLD